MDSRISVGSIAVAKVGTNVCFASEMGACYQTLEHESASVYGFIFETGRFAQFSLEDVELVLNLTGRVSEAVSDYQFRDISKLKADFRSGRFADAFPSLKGKP
jgi:hypothetical protein